MIMRKNIREMNVVSPKGDILVSPDLKVRHKASGLEYTVNDVVRGKDGSLTVLLNLPEEPRFDPPSSGKHVIRQDRRDSVMYEYDVNREASFFVPDEGSNIEPDTLAVPQEEFEKNYEVV